MKRSMAVITAVAGIFGASVALACPASADPLNGPYSGLLTDGTGRVLNTKPVTLSFAPCGSDCSRLTMPGRDIELHLKDAAWVATYNWRGSPCTINVDDGALVLNDVCLNEQPLRLALSRAG